MCDIRISLLQQGREQQTFENVTEVTVQGNSVTIFSFFEAPQTLSGVEIEKIDCLHSKVILRGIGQAAAREVEA